jgi:hypothetical protein
MSARPYSVVVPGSGWTATGPTPDRAISYHRTEASARAAFDAYEGGRAVLKGPTGVIEHRLV